MSTRHDRSATFRWALAAKILAGVAAVALIVVVALFAKVAHDVGGAFSPVRMSGVVGDTALREEYENFPLVTVRQLATIHTRMPGRAALRALGGRSPEIPVKTRIKHRWVRTGTCYDYPIAGTGHLYDGFTVADEAEICLSVRRHIVTSVTRIPWRQAGESRYGLPSTEPTT
jgi:hypothetical protein